MKIIIIILLVIILIYLIRIKYENNLIHENNIIHEDFTDLEDIYKLHLYDLKQIDETTSTSINELGFKNRGDGINSFIGSFNISDNLKIESHYLKFRDIDNYYSNCFIQKYEPNVILTTTFSFKPKLRISYEILDSNNKKLSSNYIFYEQQEVNGKKLKEDRMSGDTNTLNSLVEDIINKKDILGDYKDKDTYKFAFEDFDRIDKSKKYDKSIYDGVVQTKLFISPGKYKLKILVESSDESENIPTFEMKYNFIQEEKDNIVINKSIQWAKGDETKSVSYYKINTNKLKEERLAILFPLTGYGYDDNKIFSYSYDKQKDAAIILIVKILIDMDYSNSKSYLDITSLKKLYLNKYDIDKVIKQIDITEKSLKYFFTKDTKEINEIYYDLKSNKNKIEEYLKETLLEKINGYDVDYDTNIKDDLIGKTPDLYTYTYTGDFTVEPKIEPGLSPASEPIAKKNKEVEVVKEEVVEVKPDSNPEFTNIVKDVIILIKNNFKNIIEAKNYDSLTPELIQILKNISLSSKSKNKNETKYNKVIEIILNLVDKIKDGSIDDINNLLEINATSYRFPSYILPESFSNINIMKPILENFEGEIDLDLDLHKHTSGGRVNFGLNFGSPLNKENEGRYDEYSILSDDSKKNVLDSYHKIHSVVTKADGLVNSFVDNIDEKIKNIDYNKINSQTNDAIKQIEKTQEEMDIDYIEIESKQNEKLSRITEKVKKLEKLQNKKYLNDMDSYNSIKSYGGGNIISVKNMKNDIYNILVNDQCLDYDKKGDISIKECDNKKSQYFKMNMVENMNKYNNIVSSNSESEQVGEYDNITYPFNVLNPILHKSQCLTLNGNSIGVKECLNSNKQRWEGIKNIKLCDDFNMN